MASYNITVHGESFTVNQSFVDLCGHLNVIVSDETFDNSEIKIDAPQVTPEMFKEILRYFEMHGGKPTKGTNSLKSHKREDNMSGEDLKFMENYSVKPGDELAKLEKAASFLQIEPLKSLIVLTIATEIYFDGTFESFEEMKNRLNINSETTVDDEQKFRETYVWVSQYDTENQKEKKIL